MKKGKRILAIVNEERPEVRCIEKEILEESLAGKRKDDSTNDGCIGML